MAMQDVTTFSNINPKRWKTGLKQGSCTRLCEASAPGRAVVVASDQPYGRRKAILQARRQGGASCM